MIQLKKRPDNRRRDDVFLELLLTIANHKRPSRISVVLWSWENFNYHYYSPIPCFRGCSYRRSYHRSGPRTILQAADRPYTPLQEHR